MNDSQPAKPRRKQNPTYHVFLSKGATSPTGATPRPQWDQLTGEDDPVQAVSRKEAVEKVLAALGKPEETGPFLVVPANECWVKGKRTETKKVQVWE